MSGLCVDTSAMWIGICENVYVWNCGNNDIAFVIVDEFVCEYDYLCEECLHICICA